MEQNFEPTDLTKRKYFDILDGALSCVYFIALQYFLYIGISYLGELILNKTVYTLVSIALQACFVLAVILTSVSRKSNWVVACTFNKKITGKTVGYCVGIAIVCLIFFNSLTSAFMATLENLGYTSILNNGNVAELNKITNIGEYLLAIITTCIIPPLAEETLFRGAILNSFRGFNKWIGIFVSGFLFMLMHGNPDQTVHQLILGIMLGYIAWETRNIWVCVLIHAINNFIAITLTFALSLISQNGGADIVEGATETVTYSWGEIIYTFAYGLAMTALGIYIIVLLTRKLKKNLEEKEQKTQTNVEMLVDGKPVEAEISGVEVQPKQEIEVQGKPSKLKLALTILSYVAFSAYFIYEWVGNLLLGLSL